MALSAKPGCCEEADIRIPWGYIPCNEPATKMIGWPNRGEGPYRMCPACASHSLRNRGASDLGPFPPQEEIPHYGNAPPPGTPNDPTEGFD